MITDAKCQRIYFQRLNLQLKLTLGKLKRDNLINETTSKLEASRVAYVGRKYPTA